QAAAGFLLGVLHHDVGAGPVGDRHGEDVGEDGAVGRVGAAIAHGEHRDLIGGSTLDEGVGDAGRIGIHHAGAGLALRLETLVALDAAVVVVLGLAFLPGILHAVDAAVAQVDELHKVVEAVGQGNAAGGVGAG